MRKRILSIDKPEIYGVCVKLPRRRRRSSKSKIFIVSKKTWRKVTGNSKRKYRSCYPASMSGVGMMWEYCCNRCVDWSPACCTKCGHNQGCENSPYATRRRLSRPLFSEVTEARGWFST